MSHDFRNAENALKRAIEYENVGKQAVAMEILHAVLTSRRHRSWTKTHESIMIKVLDLCVNLRQVHMAKECLHQYRNITQTQAPHSLEVVIDHMLTITEKRTKEAAKKSQGSVDDVCEDLEAERSPESILLSAVTSDDAGDRADRELLTPWLRFLWESFRTVLDILRNNNRCGVSSLDIFFRFSSLLFSSLLLFRSTDGIQIKNPTL